MAHRHQATGQQDRDEYAERLKFAINTVRDRKVEVLNSESVPASKRTGERELARGESDASATAERRGGRPKILPGTQLWLYLDRVKAGYAWKLAHLWHVLELVGDHAARLKIRGKEYRLFPIVHIPKLKWVIKFPDRPDNELAVDQADCVDFEECLLLEYR
uniref:Uncharacterized protein n=1 Tax=Hyaloperonospora arabidopsidis (strain Emoy2) TaxID=559515 RepID=M4B2P4_HYAAE